MKNGPNTLYRKKSNTIKTLKEQENIKKTSLLKSSDVLILPESLLREKLYL